MAAIRWSGSVAGVSTRCSSSTAPDASATTPRTLVPPTSSPMAVTSGSLSVPEDGSDAPEHIEVGVAHADLDLARRGEGVLDGFLHAVVNRLHLGLADRAHAPDLADVGARPAPPAR